MRTVETIIEDFVKEAQDDFLGLWAIVGAVRDRLNIAVDRSAGAGGDRLKLYVERHHHDQRGARRARPLPISGWSPIAR